MQNKRPQKSGKNHQGGQNAARNKSAKAPTAGKSQGGAWMAGNAGKPTKQSGRPASYRSGRAPGAGKDAANRTDRPQKAWNAPGNHPPKPWERDKPGARSARPARPPLPKSAPRSMQPKIIPGRPGPAAWGHSVPPSRSRLEELLIKHGVAVPATVLDKVWQYHQILRRNNGDLDLTRLIGFETIVQRHYADCLILHKLMKGRWPTPLVDIGTGAGFPGMMLKFASPSTEIILSEPRNVRVDYLNNTIQEMGLKDISVFGHKFTSKSFQTPVRGVITRAFEPIGKTLPRLQYSLGVGGLAMFMKGPGVDEELSAPLPSNYKLVRDERYRIPATTLDRAFVVFERTA
jgi:16S rRNA (guanine527-N7)-methyltransferase